VFSDAFAEIVTIFIGPNKDRFYIHEALLKLESDYFRVALSGTWEESKTKTFTLVEENSDVFRIFVRWAYAQGFPFQTSDDEDDTDVLLVEAYLFAERRGCFRFQNEMIDNIAKWMGIKDKWLSAEAIKLAFTDTTSSSKLRRFIAEKTAWEGKVEDMLFQSEETIHPEPVIAFHKAFHERITTDAFDPSYTVCPGQSHGHHNFRCNKSGCGKAPDMALTEGSSRRIAGSDQAPYLERETFRARYHVPTRKTAMETSKKEDKPVEEFPTFEDTD